MSNLLTIKLILSCLFLSTALSFTVEAINEILEAKDFQVEFCLDDLNEGIITGSKTCKRAIFEEIKKQFINKFN